MGGICEIRGSHRDIAELGASVRSEVLTVVLLNGGICEIRGSHSGIAEQQYS